MNGNGIRETAEPGLADWVITMSYDQLTGPVTIVDTTDANGSFCFNNLTPGVYTVSEINQDDWTQTTPPSPGTYSVSLAPGQNIDSLSFGNKRTSSGACIIWSLADSTLVTSATGNISGQPEIIGQGTSAPFMSVFGYNNGQQLWVGTTGWIAGSLDPMRYIEFNAAPAPGNNLTVTSVSFNYGDFPLSVDFGIIQFQAAYSIDGWVTSTIMNSPALVYFNTTMSSFSKSINVPVPGGQTFSLRIYPFGLLHGIAMTPTFATHNNVVICGIATPAATSNGSIGGVKFNDINGNGVRDAGEPGLPNWEFTLAAAGTMKDTTDKTGNYLFNDLSPGTYTIAETNQNGWVQTTPSAPGSHTITLSAGQNIDSLNFGNMLDPCSGTKAWSPLGTGINNGTNGEVWALAVIGSDLYAGGLFTSAGGTTVNHVAKWNGSNWSALAGSNNIIGVNGAVSALAVIGTDLYVSGWFTAAGGVPAENIAKWDGANWSALGAGLPAAGSIQALAVKGNNLYAAGYIFTPGLGGPGNLIVQWDAFTSTWSALSGMNEAVVALLTDGTDLYAGGQFTVAGTVPANNIAKWNGTVWSPLGMGTDYYIGGTGMKMMAGDLYAGGRFTTAGGNAANFIARWNGTTWSSFGSGLNNGMNNSVEGFAVIGTDLYASGSFTTAEGVAANSVAKWDGTSWSPLGSGMNDGIWRLAVIGQELYAGGIFTSAGGLSANYIAKYSCSGAVTGVHDKSENLLPTRTMLKQNFPNPFNPTTKIEYRLEQAAHVSLKVYNMLGIEVATLVNGHQEAGSYSVPFGVNKETVGLASGVYFYRLEAGSFISMKKLILMK